MTDDLSVAALGRYALRRILDDRDFFGKEESVEWCELLAKYGYAERVAYDPSRHDPIEYAEAGDQVWIFTAAMKRDAG